ncbi:VTC domain-containing protein [Streptomyces sp. NPDC020742]|uniref:VTC domain-containing protein n=1 Tax=Streptomyces sp. NPDC020742 TaxID=3154897 RepID=UPI0033FEDD48
MIPAVRALARAAMAARPVPLADVQARAGLLTRFDRSYLVPVEVFAAVAADLTDRRRPGGPFAALCINGRRWFPYRSVHYDTPDLRSFHDHREDGRQRWTIRERLYADTGERQFEVKLRGRRGETVKHRQPLPPGAPALGAAPRGFLAAVLDRAYGITAPADLGHHLETDYLRATFVAHGQRITCDAALLCRDPATGRTVRADGGLVLVGTRSAGRHPTEADRLLHGHGVRPAGFTKYGGGLSALRPDLAAGRWGPEARQAVRTVFPAAGRALGAG